MEVPLYYAQPSNRHHLFPQPQKTVNTAGENIEIAISGRHDPVIVPRAVVVVESMAAITLTDLLMQNMTSRIEYLKNIYL